MSRRFALVQVSVLALAAVWIWASRVPPGLADQSSLSVPYIGFLAPDLEVTTLTGQQARLSDFRGAPVLLNFWATWCPPCRAEMPAFQQIFNDYQEAGLVVLAVNATHLDSLPEVKNFLQEYKLTLPVFLDTNGSASSLYQVRAMPTTFFIGRDGKINDIEFGGPLSEATIRLKVEELLKNERRP